MGETDFSKTLKARRREMGLTLAKLAELSGVDKSHLGRMENGRRFPSANVLGKLAGPLGIDERDLFMLTGYLSPDATDERITRFKAKMEGEIRQAMSNLLEKVDTL